ncbi:unnamed protein product [Microthlaspi erraticum]|uniref:Uncharacterized protein n=1 Tax=Microthlaspi erraticum TaxID=1685480 RepID=A0A6D2II44_9BRAS|nr:unnamed protein product [Microthlaspi erraticum]
MVTVRLRLANDIFFDCVKWNHGVLRLVAEKRTPNRHTADAIVFNLREITQKNPNVVTETSNPANRKPFFSESLQIEQLRFPLSLPACVDYWNRHREATL